MAVVGVVLASAVMAATIGCGKGAPTAGDTQVTTPPQSPTASTAAVTPEVAPTPTKNPTEYAASMAQYKNMDVNTFEALPRNDRLAYSQYVNETLVFGGDYDSHYGHGLPNYVYAVQNYVASPDNTGQEIVDENLYQNQLAFLQYTQSSYNAETNVSSYNISDGRKALSSVYYNVGEYSSTNVVTGDYQTTVSFQKTLTKPEVLNNTATVKDTGELMTGTDSQGNTVQYKDVTWRDQDGTMHYDRYVLTTYTDYDGSMKSIWLLETQADSAADRDSWSTIK